MAHHKANKHFYGMTPKKISVSLTSISVEAKNSSDNYIRVYTDASFSIENNIGVTSFVLTKNNEHIYESTCPLDYGNGSTFAELVAIERALDYVYDNFEQNASIELYTDSKMSVNIVNGTTKLKKSKKDYWKVVDNIKNKQNIQLNYVRAHTNSQSIHSLYNSQADRLCKKRLKEIVSLIKKYKKSINSKIYNK